MAGPVGKLTAILGIDSREFTAGLDTAKKSISGFSSGSQLAFGVTSAAFGGAALAVAKFGLQSQDAQGKFMAATGASREEAQAFVKDMDGLAGTAGAVGLSFDQIAAAGTAVSQQFGITGKDAQTLTGNILEFAKVTGSDATQTAKQLEDTMTALGLSTDQATGFMDELVVSSQTYGTDVGPEQLAILQKMAPALDALGASASDGVGLLNAFEAAGVDAGGAVKDLTAAITKFPPGTTLNDVITQLGKVEDPAKRSALAVELLGAKAGPQLAKVIKPGMTSLDNFAISADDAGTHLHTAADGMLTDADKIRGGLDKLSAGLRDIGTDFGPLLAGLGGLATIAAPFADQIKKLAPLLAPAGAFVGSAVGEAQALAQQAAATGTAAVKAMFARIAAMAIPLAPAGTTIGTAIGAAMGAATTVGFIGALAAGGLVIDLAPFLGVELGKSLASDIVRDRWIAGGRQAAQNYAAAFGAETSTKTGQIFEDAVRGALASGATESDAVKAGEAAVKAFLAGMTQAVGVGEADFAQRLGGKLVPMGAVVGQQTGEASGKATFDAYMDYLNSKAADVKPAGANFVGAFADGVDGGLAALPTIPLSDIIDWRQTYKDSYNAGAGVVDKVTQGMMDNESALVSGANDLRDLLKNGLTPEDLATKAIGKKYVTLIEQGLDSEVIGAKQKAQALAGEALQAIVNAADNGVLGGKDAKAVGRYLGDLVNSGVDDVNGFLTGAGLSEEQIAGIKSLFPQFFNTGSAASDKTNAGFTSDPKSNRDAGDTVADDIKTGLKSNPWFRWGRNVSQEWVNGFTQAIRQGKGDIRDALRNATGGMIAFSPPKEGPLTEIDAWGFNIGKTWIDNLGMGIAAGKNALLGDLPSQLSRAFAPPGIAVAMASGSHAGGDTYIININGPVYGGPAGVDQLIDIIEGRLRQRTRGANYQAGR